MNSYFFKQNILIFKDVRPVTRRYFAVMGRFLFLKYFLFSNIKFFLTDYAFLL